MGLTSVPGRVLLGGWLVMYASYWRLVEKPIKNEKKYDSIVVKCFTACCRRRAWLSLVTFGVGPCAKLTHE